MLLARALPFRLDVCSSALWRPRPSPLLCVMAPTAEENVVLAKMSSDLKFLFDKEEVTDAVQIKIADAGITNMRTFAAFAKDADDLRAVAKSDLDLDPAEGLAKRVTLSKLVVAWETARKRTDKTAEIQAEAEARDVPKRLTTPDYRAMRTLYEKTHGELDESNAPAKGYVEGRMSMVEKFDFKAELLSEVMCIEEEGGETLRPVWDTNGTLKAVKLQGKVPLPINPEQLRYRLSLMAAAWGFIRLVHSSRTMLDGVTPQLFISYADYLLGENCLGHLNHEVRGEQVGPRAWELLLSYEQSIRKQAMANVMRGMGLPAALRKAWEDALVKERKFTTPMGKLSRTLETGAPGGGAWKRKFDEINDAAPPGRWRPGGQGKGKGKKGKAAGKGRSPPVWQGQTCKARLAEGKMICWPFNAKDQKCTAGRACTFEHVCGICFKVNVPMHACTH